MEKWLEMMQKTEEGREKAAKVMDVCKLFYDYVEKNRLPFNPPERAESVMLLAIKYSQFADACNTDELKICDYLPKKVSEDELLKFGGPSDARYAAYPLIMYHETPMRIIKGIAGTEEINRFYAWLFDGSSERRVMLYIIIKCLMEAKDPINWMYDYQQDVGEIVTNQNTNRFDKRTMSERLKQLKPLYHPELDKEVDKILTKYSFVDAGATISALTSEALNSLLTRIASNEEFKYCHTIDFSRLDQFLTKREDGKGEADGIRRIFLNTLDKIGESDACNISFEKEGPVVKACLNMAKDVSLYVESLEGMDRVASIDAISQLIGLYLKNL